jgi:alpha-tubulin suppressor-like RCC1 family protein
MLLIKLKKVLVLLTVITLIACEEKVSTDEGGVEEAPSNTTVSSTSTVPSSVPVEAAIALELASSFSLDDDCRLTHEGSLVFGESTTYLPDSASLSSVGLGLSSFVADDSGYSALLDRSSLTEDKNFEFTWSVLAHDSSEFSISKSYSLKLSSASNFPLKVPTIEFPGHHGKQPSAQASAQTCSGGFESSLMLGWTHGCVLAKDGQVACWGNNVYGAFGNGEQNLDSMDVVGIDGSNGNSATYIDVGYRGGCAVMDDSTVRCWGSGYTGPSVNTPSVIDNFGATAGNIPTSIAVGQRDHACAVMDDSKLRCWKGDGVAPAENTTFNASVAGLQVEQVSVGINHHCALMKDESVKCWGANGNGQLGQGTVGTPASTTVPAVALGIDGSAGQEALQVISGNYSSCALMKTGTVLCWGRDSWNTLGNGDGSTADSATPTAVNYIDGSTGKKAVSINEGMASSVCATLDTGALYCWGLNSIGQLGSGNTDDFSEPGPIAAFDGSTPEKTVLTYEGGWTTSCALHSNNAVSCSGSSEKIRNIQAPIYGIGPQFLKDFDGSAGKKAAQVAVGENLSCIRAMDGAVKCFGWVQYLGHGEQLKSTGVEYASKIGNELPKAKQVHVQGEIATCAILTDDSLSCWGYNSRGLGFGSDEVILSKPSIVDFFDGTDDSRKVVSVGGGYYQSCVLSKLGAVHCWGYNSNSELGDGTIISKPDATPVVGLDGSTGNKVVAISSDSAFGHSNCAIMETGALKCWGHGAYGQIGNSLSVTQATPVDVTGIDGSTPSTTAVAVAKGRRHTCAIMATGAAKCWGTDGNGQLGNGTGTTGDQNAPTDVVGIDGTAGKKAVAISAGRYSTCALMENGAVMCWGKGSSGELGNGVSADEVEPSLLPAIDGTGGKRAQAIASGYDYACAAMEDGGVKCWGKTNYNTLGHDSISPSTENYPVDVLGPEEVNGGSSYIDGAIPKIVESIN